MSDQELAEKQRMLQERQAQLAALQAQRAQMENQQQQGGYPQQQQQQGGYPQQQQQQQANWGYAPHMHHHQGPPQHRQHGHHHHHHHHSQNSAAPYRGGGGGGGGGGRGGGGYQPQQQWGGQQGGASQWGQAAPQHQHHHSRGGGGGKYQQHPKPVYTEEFVDDDDEEFDEDYDEFDDYVFEEDAAKANAAAPVGPDKDYEEMVAEAEAAAADRSAASGGGAQLDSDEVFAMAKNPDGVKARTLGDYATAGKLKNLRDNDGRTVLHYVAETSFADLAKQVASTVDATVADENGMLAADVAAICGNKEMCAALSADPAQRGALLKKFRVLPPRFAVVKSAPKQKPKRRGAFWGNPVSNPDAAVTLKASELGDASATVPEVEAAAFVIPATPLDWTKPSLSFSEEYHARIHCLSVAARDTVVIATADVTPIGNILVNGEKQAQAAYAVGCVRTQRGGLRHLANFVAGYLQQCVAGFVSPNDLSPVMPPVCAIKWYQRSVNAMAALAGPAASLLFPDVNKYYSVTRTDVLRKHDVAPEDAAATEWRVATDDDALTMAGLFAAKNGDFVLSFDPSEEAVKHLFFGCNVVSLVTNDGSACAVFQKRDQRGHESAILVASSLSTSAGLDDVCSAVRQLMPNVATVYAATLGLSDYCLSGANFALIEGSHQHFYAACDPSTPVLTGAQASKVRFPLFF